MIWSFKQPFLWRHFREENSQHSQINFTTSFLHIYFQYLNTSKIFFTVPGQQYILLPVVNPCFNQSVRWIFGILEAHQQVNVFRYFLKDTI